MAVTHRIAGDPAATTRAVAPSGGSGYCACHCRERGGPSGDNARRSPFWRLWLLRLPLQRQPVTIIALQITMAVTHRAAGGPAATTRAAAPSGGSGYCACHCRERGGSSGDNARRRPFWRLWLLRLPLQRARGAQRRQRAPQPLLEALATAPATAESEGGPAATTRAAAPSGTAPATAESERAQRRQRAPPPLLEALATAPATAESEGGPAATTRAAAPSGGSGSCACHCRERGGPSGDNARRSPFWRLWLLRLPLQRQPVTTIALQITMAVTHRAAGGPAATTRAAAPSGGSGYCACHHCRERGGSSGDNARRRPFWRLWLLRLPLQRARGAQRRQRAPQPLLEALATAPATAESEGGPAATTRAAAPSGGSGYCACHCRERGGPSADNARRRPFWRLWLLRLPLQRARGAQRRQRAPQPLLEALVTAPATAESEGGPAATMRAAAPSEGSGYCACHCRERGGPSGDNARRSPFWRLWLLRLPLQRARGPQRRQRAPPPLLEALATAPATAESEGGPAATMRAAGPSGRSGCCE